MRRIETGSDSPIYYQFDQWQDHRFRHGVFTRHGGVSETSFASLNVGGTVGDNLDAVAENHRRMYAALNLKPEQTSTVWQVHGNDVVVSHGSQPQRKWLSRADAMITDEPGVGLAMRFADCVPIMFYDPEHHALGIAHAGWRGTVTKIVQRTVQAMQNVYGTNPAELQAGIGPSIGPEHYQVGEEVVIAVQESFGTTEAIIARAEDGSAYLNLWTANEMSLREIGVQAIERANICTATYTEDFYSHRAENGKTGRFGAVMVLDEH